MSEWISVKERLPGLRELCIITDPTMKYCFVAFFVDAMPFYHFQVNGSPMQVNTQSITHWMPLPNPPKVEEQK